MKIHRAILPAESFPSLKLAGRLHCGALAALLLSASTLLFTGCGTARFRVASEASTVPAPATGSYRLSIRGAQGPAGAGLVDETAGCLRVALASHGLREAPAGEPADTVILVEVGMAPARALSVVEPDPFGERMAWPTSGVVVLNPFSDARYDADGLPLNVVTRLARPKFLRIMACDLAPLTDGPASAADPTAKVPRPQFLRVSAPGRATVTRAATARRLWQVEVTNDDESAALDAYVPLMVAAAMDSLSPVNQGTTMVKIPHGGRRLAFLRTQQ